MQGKKIWEWRFLANEQKLHFLHSGGMDVFERSTRRQYYNLSNRYEKRTPFNHKILGANFVQFVNLRRE